MNLKTLIEMTDALIVAFVQSEDAAAALNALNEIDTYLSQSGAGRRFARDRSDLREALTVAEVDVDDVGDAAVSLRDGLEEAQWEEAQLEKYIRSFGRECPPDTADLWDSAPLEYLTERG